VIGVQHNLAEFNHALRLYADLSRKTPEDTLKKQGGKLGFAIRERLKMLSPAKGQVRQERLAALKAGEGVRVRSRVREEILQKHGRATDIVTRRQKIVAGNKAVGSVVGGRHSGVGFRYGRMNLQALMVQRELNVRESGRQFLSVTARYPKTLRDEQFAHSRYGPILSEAGLNANKDTLTFGWDSSKSNLSGEAAGALDKPKARYAIALALRDTTADILEYTNRKIEENGKEAGLL
jgi:hypothetical protein